MSITEAELDLRVEKQRIGNVDPGECDEHEIAAGKTTARRPGAASQLQVKQRVIAESSYSGRVPFLILPYKGGRA